MGKGKRNRGKNANAGGGGGSAQPLTGAGGALQYASLGRHHRKGKTFVPPLVATLPGLSLASWLDDRVPEMLWAALVVSAFDRDTALRGLRTVANVVERHGDATSTDVTLSGLAAFPGDARREVLGALCAHTESRRALRPLLLLDGLPGRDEWAVAIAEEPVADEDWLELAAAVELVADHQSQAATDVRWVRVLATLVGGRMRLLRETADLAEEILGYPDAGHQPKVRATIRATEGSLDVLIGPNDSTPVAGEETVFPSGEEGGGVPPTTGAPTPPPWAPRVWAPRFWDACLAATPCRPVSLPEPAPTGAGTTRDLVRAALTAVATHAERTRISSGVDARHEGAFGLAQYAVMLLDELLGLGVSAGALGRAGLRSLLECELTLAYLAHKDDPTTWVAYRHYGAGQAKLAFLKLDEAAALPEFVDVKLLEALANEDRWQEYVTIEVGHWDGSNLRETSDRAGRKNEYDRYYPWTSAFVHGNWAAVRTTTYDLCTNPLHRWHRVLRTARAPLGDIVPDAARLVDLTLETLDQLYPGVGTRVTVPAPPACSFSQLAT